MSFHDVFSIRYASGQDIALIGDSFTKNYISTGNVYGVREEFNAFIATPFRQMVLASQSDENDEEHLVSIRVCFPLSKPNQIAGWHMYSPRYKCLIYLLVKPDWQKMDVARHLLDDRPPRHRADQDRFDSRPFFIHCFSTRDWSNLCRALNLRVKYSPFMFLKIASELREQMTDE